MDIFLTLLGYGTLLGLALAAIYALKVMLPRLNFSGWNRFWFTPANPTILACIRITCGAITTYTVFACTFMLQDSMGPNAWYDLPLRLDIVRNRPNFVIPLSGRDYSSAVATTPLEKDYQKAYKERWGVLPPPPFPKTELEAEYLYKFRLVYGSDLRMYGLPMPTDEEDWKLKYIDEYMKHPANVLKRPPPAYPASAAESQEIFAFMARNMGVDPRLLYSFGQPAWSIWFHVTDPAAMAIIHGLVVLVTFLFTIGFCTRITSVLTWMTSLWYIHRNPAILFGVDTMMMIVLLYLMIGSSGGALSVDRLIARWWSKAKPRVINRWRALWRMPALAETAIRPAAYSVNPVPTVSTNFALRLLQIHLCIIYLVSGLTKLQGTAWWNGTAVWGTLANFEFAPMALDIGGMQVYTEFLRWLGQDKLRIEFFLTFACYFTLAFEIGYAFLIWRPSLRWLFLIAAILLHGLIGLFMGLQTFSLMMLVMNMAFLRHDEVLKVLATFARPFRGSAQPLETVPVLAPAAPGPVLQTAAKP